MAMIVEVDPQRTDQRYKKKKGDAGRMRHKGSPGKVFEIIDLLKTKDQYTIIAKNLKNCGFGGILHICKWSSIPTLFVKWIVANFEKEGGPLIRLSKTKVLKLTAEDVHRVYNLPRGHTRIDLSQCTTEAIIRLRKELHLTGEYSISINVKDLEERLQSLKNVKAWTKAAIIYIIFCLLCPVNSNNASLEYALILEDMDNLTTYNWCQHVLNHVKDGIRETNRLTPTADFHFLMINYLDRTGKDCPFMNGKYKRPSLRGWNVKECISNLFMIDKLVGLEKGVIAGITKEIRQENGPVLLPFDPEMCRIYKSVAFCTSNTGETGAASVLESNHVVVVPAELALSPGKKLKQITSGDAEGRPSTDRSDAVQSKDAPQKFLQPSSLSSNKRDINGPNYSSLLSPNSVTV